MDLSTTLIWNDVSKILYTNTEPYVVDYSVVISTVDKDISIGLIDLLAVQSNYLTAIGDYIVLRFHMGLGTFTTDVYPFRDNLEVTLTKKVTYNKKKIKTVTRYKAIILNYDNILDGTNHDNVPKDVADVHNLATIDLQLMDTLVEVLRTIQVSGVYVNLSNKDALLTVYSNESKKISIDGKKGLDAITIAPPDNTKVYDHIVLPSELHLLDLSTFLQKKNHGVYRGGIGTYLLQHDGKRSCFIYPLYNFESYKKPVPKLTVYAIPTNRFNLSKSTWLVDNTNLSIVVGEDGESSNPGETDYMNSGVGFRMADAGSFMKKPVKMTKDGPVASRSHLNYEIINKDRTDGVNYAPYVKAHSTPYENYSKVIEREGYPVTIYWKDSNSDLIYPGMPCKYIFMKMGTIYSTMGQVVYKEALQSREGDVTTRLVLFIRRVDFSTKAI